MAKGYSLQLAEGAIIAVLIIFSSARLTFADSIAITPEAASAQVREGGSGALNGAATDITDVGSSDLLVVGPFTNHTHGVVYDMEITWTLKGGAKLDGCEVIFNDGPGRATCASSGNTTIVSWGEGGLEDRGDVTFELYGIFGQDVGSYTEPLWTVPEPPTTLLVGTALLGLAIGLRTKN
jgi:hypothetical protein